MQKILCQDFGEKASKGVQNIKFVQLQLLLHMYPLLHVAHVYNQRIARSQNEP